MKLLTVRVMPSSVRSRLDSSSSDSSKLNVVAACVFGSKRDAERDAKGGKESASLHPEENSCLILQL